MATESPDNSVILDLSGSTIPMVRTLLSQVPLDNIDSIRVEIEGIDSLSDVQSPSPPPSEESETTDNDTPQSQSENESHVTDELVTVESSSPDLPEQFGKSDFIESNEPDIDIPEEPRLSDLPQYPLSPGTAKWTIMATLFRTDGYLPLARIEKMNKGTEWEYAYGTLSGSLTKLVENGMVVRHKKKGYQLTEMGRAFVTATRKAKGGDLSP